SGYVRRVVSDRDIRPYALKVLKPLMTDVGPKKVLPVATIARQAAVSEPIVRGCLVRLAETGLVRAVHEENERWEMAHDFVARLVQPFVQNWRQTTWEALRPWLGPTMLAAWLIVVGLAVVFIPEVKDAIATRELARVGLVSVNTARENEHLFKYIGAVVAET